MSIQDIIQALIDDGLTQLEIADKAVVCQSQLSDLLRGRRKDIAYSSGKRIEALAIKRCPQIFRAKRSRA